MLEESHREMHYAETDAYIRVASFDIGLKNMSFCVIDFNNNDFNIKKWTNLSLHGKNISDFTKDIIEKLRMHSFGCLDYVLIEQQINRNTQMKVMSHVIQTFFICDLKIQPHRVQFVSPKKRLDMSSPIHGTVVQFCKDELALNDSYTRKEYKMISVAIAEKYLGREKLLYWKQFFVASPKKDDLADSFVQAIAWNFSTSIMDIE